MIIAVTGMVGLNKKSYLEAVCTYAAQQGQDITLANVGDRMYAEAHDIPPGKILDISMKRLSSLRRSVFKDIISTARQVPHLLINTHATFRWRHGLFPAVDFDQMRALDIDMYVCMIDGVAGLHDRLQRDHAMDHTLKDLIVWREEEIIGTEMLRRGINERVPFYCLALGNQASTVETFYRLAFDSQTKKAYLSFPMTAVSHIPEVQSQILEFRRLMTSVFVCFDPADVEESDLPFRARQALEQGRQSVEAEVHGHTVSLSCQELCEVERDIYSQTYARDFMLVDQSDMIISFIPPMPDGRAAISSGVERELQHAHEAAKEVYVIWTADQAPSVFVTQTATEVFRNLNEAVACFTQKGYVTV
jgi:adenylate kinase